MTLMEAACRCCGSPNVTWVEAYGPTGVIAPDGGAEYRYEAGVRCSDCGAIEDEPDVSDTAPVTERGNKIRGGGVMTMQALTIHETSGATAAQQQGLNH